MSNQSKAAAANQAAAEQAQAQVVANAALNQPGNEPEQTVAQAAAAAAAADQEYAQAAAQASSEPQEHEQVPTHPEYVQTQGEAVYVDGLGAYDAQGNPVPVYDDDEEQDHAQASADSFPTVPADDPAPVNGPSPDDVERERADARDVPPTYYDFDPEDAEPAKDTSDFKNALTATRKGTEFVEDLLPFARAIPGVAIVETIVKANGVATETLRSVQAWAREAGIPIDNDDQRLIQDLTERQTAANSDLMRAIAQS